MLLIASTVSDGDGDGDDDDNDDDGEIKTKKLYYFRKNFVHRWKSHQHIKYCNEWDMPVMFALWNPFQSMYVSAKHGKSFQNKLWFGITEIGCAYPSSSVSPLFIEQINSSVKFVCKAFRLNPRGNH